jgi:hypothetical protein
MRYLLLFVLLIPFGGNSQSQDSIVHFDNILSIPSPRQTMFLLKDFEVLNDSIYTSDLKPTSSESIRLLRAGFLNTQYVYSKYTDTTLTDSTRFVQFDFSPIFDSTKIQFDQLQTRRKPEPLDSSLVEYFQTYALIQSTTADVEDVQSNYLLHIGEWIEGLYLTSIVAVHEKDKDLKNRIAENSSTLDRVILKLFEFNDPTLQPTIDALKKLQATFTKIKSEYTYKEPTQDSEAKTTTFGSTVKTKVSKGTLIEIKDQLYHLHFIILN